MERVDDDDEEEEGEETGRVRRRQPRGCAPTGCAPECALSSRRAELVPSDDLQAAGVLVHINDRTEDPAHRWKPCYKACNHGQYADRVSCSLINARQPKLWPGGGGLVLSPHHAKVRCSYGCDGATNSKRKPGGCLPVVCNGPPGNCQSCAFASSPPSSRMRCALGLRSGVNTSK